MNRVTLCLAVGFAALCAFGVPASADAQNVMSQASTANRPLAVQGGRFVFGQITNMRRDQYMLDTQTGRLWQLVESDPGPRLRAVEYSHAGKDGAVQTSTTPR